MFKSRTVTISLRFYGAPGRGRLRRRLRGRASPASTARSSTRSSARSIWAGRAGSATTSATPCWSAWPRAAIFLAALFTAFRDADADAEAEAAGLDTVPLARAPLGANYWPVVSAFAVGGVLVGLAISQQGAGPDRRRRAGRHRGHVDHAGLGRAGHRRRPHQPGALPAGGRAPAPARHRPAAGRPGDRRASPGCCSPCPTSTAPRRCSASSAPSCSSPAWLIALRPKISRTPMVLAIFVLGRDRAGRRHRGRRPRAPHLRAPRPHAGKQVQSGSGR